MKRKLSFIIILLLSCICTNVCAKDTPPKVIGHIYSTDIVAYIDDMAIPSYNIGGMTCVSEKDLKNYGFDLKWDSLLRTLYINFNKKLDNAPNYSAKKSKSGKVLGNIYETDIKVWVNAWYFKAYNIGGETMIPLEDLGKDIEDSHYENYNKEIGFSNCGFKVLWNAKKRTIKAYTLHVGNILKIAQGVFNIIDTCYNYNSASPYNDYFNTRVLYAYNKQDYVNIEDLLNILKIQYKWENNKLIINKPITKKYMNMSNGSEIPNYGTDSAILPVTQVSVCFNVDGKVIERKYLCILYCGGLYTSLIDLKPYLIDDKK